MSGAYCRYCDHRCFVDRIVPGGHQRGWSGHLATCARGMEHDRQVLGGYDHTNTINPVILAELIYVRDGDGVIHLADEAPLGGYVTGCDLFGDVQAVEPVPLIRVCSECSADAAGLAPAGGRS